MTASCSKCHASPKVQTGIFGGELDCRREICDGFVEATLAPRRDATASLSLIATVPMRNTSASIGFGVLRVKLDHSSAFGETRKGTAFTKTDTGTHKSIQHPAGLGRAVDGLGSAPIVS